MNWKRIETGKQPQAGFTFFELLVVTAIIGVLVGLRMPAVLAAWRVSCNSMAAGEVIAWDKR